MNIVLVRSPGSLLSQGLAGYGWPQVDFSQAESLKELLAQFKATGTTLGRQKNQVKRFYQIKEGDVIVVPLSKAIALGVATGQKSFGEGVEFGSNRVHVRFFQATDGSLLRIPRESLSGALSTRLRIRMSVVYLNDFTDEIQRVVEEVEKNGGYSLVSHLVAKESELADLAKATILANIKAGKTYLKSGGEGLERLVGKLLEIEGYSVKIASKREFDDKADADVLAEKYDTFSSAKLLIQVKHHSGFSSAHAVRQLAAIKEDAESIRWVITTADVSEKVRQEAEASNVKIMDGSEFVDWLFENLNSLDTLTRQRLNISTVPNLLS